MGRSAQPPIRSLPWRLATTPVPPDTDRLAVGGVEVADRTVEVAADAQITLGKSYDAARTNAHKMF